MRLLRPVSIALVLFAVLATTQIASAQGSVAPNQQFGIGVNTGGFQLQYALSPSMQLGANLSLRSGESTTFYTVGPYFRVLLEGTVNPFFQIGFSFSDDGDSATSATTALYGAFGLEYFINRNVGVWFGATLLDVYLDPSATYFGFYGPAAGLEWYFN